MRPNIDFGECLKDSPRFRASLEDAETEVDILESKLDKLVKLCSAMIEAGKVFNNANGAFINGVLDVAQCFKEDEFVSKALSRFTQGLTELQKYRSILLDQAHRSICKNLNNFIKNDIRKVKETRKHFEKISDDMDNALMKNAQSPRSRPQDCEDATNVLMAMRSCFGHTSLDYVFQINILHSKKRFDVLHTMLDYMHAQNAYFHQGHDLSADLEPYMKQVAAQLEDLNMKAAAERKEMEERHTLVQQREVWLSAPLEQNDQDTYHEIKMEGYLYKRTSNAFKTWVRKRDDPARFGRFDRRWFMIHNNQLVYQKRSGRDSQTTMEEDLRLCTVKPAVEIDKRYCFEVVSPGRSHMLQADSDNECQAWISAIQAGVSKAYRDAPTGDEWYQPKSALSRAFQEQSQAKVTQRSNMEESSTGSVVSSTETRSSQSAASVQPPSKQKSRMDQILSISGNDRCADCQSPDPRWASINLGITLCIECSGIHRSFGVHMSKVRSVTLDAWEPELLKVMAELGNTVVNRIYEASVDETNVARATPQCNRSEREVWIRSKYIDKTFVRRLPKGCEGESTEGSTVKHWSVYKRKRRSPSKSVTEGTQPGNADAGGQGSADGTKTAMVQGESKDSGLGGSTPDVIVFGATLQPQIDISAIDNDADSESSTSEPEGEPDSRSTTSFEDVSKLGPDLLLYRAAQARNLGVMLEALAAGANPNWSRVEENGKTPLIMAIESGSMAPCELLLLNGAKVDRKDGHGRTPLHHATMLGHTGQVCQLLKRNANQHAVDGDGKDPLSIAISAANADIVTLLRLAKLNEEMKETEGFFGGPGDETFTEVFRDFTNMANNTPEKLNRNK